MDLSVLQTEGSNPNTTTIDRLPTLELCEVIHNEDSSIPSAITPYLPTIASAIDAIALRIRAGGRLIYTGAGTSGRLGVLDASEIPPTFSAPREQFVGVIAGGEEALRVAKEGAEDDLEAAERDFEALGVDGEVDSLIGIAASGRTPYVLRWLALAKEKGCVTVGVACVKPLAMGASGNVDFMVEAVTGPEVVSGSTRMKAGTATKLVLNMLSTGVMIKCGKTFGNVMIDVKPTNVKLQMRARRILRQICGDRCPAFDAENDEILLEADRSVKLAATKILLDVSISEARERLDQAGGVLAEVMNSVLRSSNGISNAATEAQLVLCVDGGGSKCSAVIANQGGQSWAGMAGPCNPGDTGVEASLAQIALAVRQAVQSCPYMVGKRIDEVSFRMVSVGIAGIDREPWRSGIHAGLVKLLGKNSASNLSVFNDLELLGTIAARKQDARDVIVLICGTGSIAMRYRHTDGNLVRLARAGGWGALLGDDGSGFDIGRQGVRLALEEADSCDSAKGISSDPLIHVITTYLKSGRQSLLDSILNGESHAETKQKVASCAKLVLDAIDTSLCASRIIDAAQDRLMELVRTVNSATTGLSDDKSVLVLGGGLMQSGQFRGRLKGKLKASRIYDGPVECIDNLALRGALFMARQL